VIVKGKTEPEAVYAIVGAKEVESTSEFRSLRELLSGLITSYRSRDWQAAADAIERGRASEHAGRLKLLLGLYAERIQEFQTNPPPDDWNGAYALLTK
jgi:adenylate cyclase